MLLYSFTLISLALEAFDLMMYFLYSSNSGYETIAAVSQI